MKIVSITPRAVSIESEIYGTRAYMHNDTGHKQLQLEAPELLKSILEKWNEIPMVKED